MKDVYILFTADFDEEDSCTEHFDSKEDLLQYIEDWDDSEMYGNLIRDGYHKKEWWNFHLVKVGKKVGETYE